MNEPNPVNALEDAANHLQRLGIRFAIVGGIATSIRGEVRFTRDVDIAIAVQNDSELDTLVLELRDAGYEVAGLAQQKDVDRTATVGLVSPSGLLVHLLAATCGIETEIAARAEPVRFSDDTPVPVACTEELMAMKILSMTEKRLQDRIDAGNLLAMNPDMDLGRVRANLQLITERGYARDQDLAAKLDHFLAAVQAA
jgi:predicted nucleotidyltransferase